MSVKILDISDNCLNEIPKEIKDSKIQLKYENNLLDDSDDGSGHELDFLFGNHNKTNNVTYSNSQNILDYFPERENSHYQYPFVSYSPPKPKYIYIKHKKRIIV